ncbi:hypothetical protein F5X98DRAFT_380891 [Xylaria grammica]|nr:hypothetical protein F5X98DRAFT_380891 [Xylaria grammica]
MAAQGSSSSGTAGNYTEDLIPAPQATSYSNEGAEMSPSALSRAEIENSPAIEGTAAPRRRDKHVKPRLKTRRLPRQRQIAEAHDTLLAAAMGGDLDPAKIRGNSDIFERGVMKSSILHLMSERWNVEMEPLFREVMMEVSRRGDKDLKLYLLTDELGRTILDRSRSETTNKAFVEFFFQNYTSEAIELLKRDPELLMFLLSARHRVDWGLICRELHELLLNTMRDKSQNTFLHRVVRFPVDDSRVGDAGLVETVVKEVIEAEPKTILALNGEGKSAYQLCAEAIRESRNTRHSVKSSDSDEEDDDYDDYDDMSDGIPDESTGGDDGNVVLTYRIDFPDEGKAEKRFTSTETAATEILYRVSDMLKEEIFRRCEDANQIRQLLSPEDRENEIELDFSELGDIKDVRALSRLAELASLRIKDLLRYVKLPANKTNEPSDLRARRGAISGFFSYLKTRIKSIVYLQVDESIYHPCPDNLIESALRGLKIYTLDWRKTDLCAQVVLNAAPDVEVLHIYCSGNRGVLLSWSAPDGLPLLPNLREVNISVLTDRVEPRELIQEYLREFRRRLNQNTESCRPGVITHVGWTFYESCGSTWSSSLAGRESMERPGFEDVNDRQVRRDSPMYTFEGIFLLIFSIRHFWVDKLMEYSVYISRKVSLEMPEDRFPRVAVVDDGVSIADFPSRENISVVGGRSFSPPTSDASKPWFFSTNGHGTTMARIISSLNPKTQFLIARTHFSRGISERAIAKALEWCIEERADIICLGMTLGARHTSDNPEHTMDPNLAHALKRVVDAGIIVLMPVLEPRIGELTGEAYSHTEGVLKIAASRWSEFIELPPPLSADFTLIDDVSKVLGGRGEGNMIHEIKGNSVATAVASGLAALILLYVRSHRDKSTLTGKAMGTIFKSLQAPGGGSKMILAGKLGDLVVEAKNPGIAVGDFILGALL